MITKPAAASASAFSPARYYPRKYILRRTRHGASTWVRSAELVSVSIHSYTYSIRANLSTLLTAPTARLDLRSRARRILWRFRDNNTIKTNQNSIRAFACFLIDAYYKSEPFLS